MSLVEKIGNYQIYIDYGVVFVYFRWFLLKEMLDIDIQSRLFLLAGHRLENFVMSSENTCDGDLLSGKLQA